MELDLNQNLRQIITFFILIVLPVILLLLIFAVDYKQSIYLYVGLMTWLGLGVIFYGAIK